MSKKKRKTQADPSNPTAPAAEKQPPARKTEEELAKMKNWQRVRYEFSLLPEHRQLLKRLQRASGRLAIHVRRTRGWAFPTVDGNGAPADAAAAMTALMQKAAEALQEAAVWNQAIPDDWKPTRASGGSALKTIAPGSLVKLKGSAAKAEPEMAKTALTFVESYGDPTRPRARLVAADGTKFACAFRDLSPA